MSRCDFSSTSLFARQLMLLALLHLLAGGAAALPSDSQQSIDLQADDQAVFDIGNNTQTLRGNVVMRQGSMHISASKMVIYSDGKKITRIVATGKPAQFSQTPREGEQPVIAKAFRLEYDVEGKTLHLIDQASIVQQGASLSGNRIDYDVKKALVKADGSGSGGRQGRVRMVIPPQNPKEGD